MTTFFDLSTWGWWNVANDRRQQLILRKHGVEAPPLTPAEFVELRILQDLAGSIVDAACPAMMELRAERKANPDSEIKDKTV